MGTIKKGILGGFSGKEGTVIGANWCEIDVMRSLPKKSKNLPTASQLEQRLRFGLAMSFLSPIKAIKAIIDKAYGTHQGAQSKLTWLFLTISKRPLWVWHLIWKLILARLFLAKENYWGHGHPP